MKKKNVKKYYCVVCRTHTNGAGLTFNDGTHICYDCAEMIHDVMTNWHKDHLDHCEYNKCQPKAN